MMSRNLILVIGLFRRTGTTHLRDLLCCHRDCVPSPIPEDFLLARSSLLIQYANETSASWGASSRTAKPHLMDALRWSLMRFLSGGHESFRIVSKTPTVEGIELIDEVFPNAKVVLIIRDGRDTLESGRRSFNWNLLEGAKLWRKNVERLLSFQQERPGRALIVRFEDLVSDMRGTMTRVLEHCNLDNSRYGWEQAARAPVRGSSDQVRDTSERGMDWHPRIRSADFSPIGRWKSWSARDRQDFEAGAGDALWRLGYR